MSSSWIWSDKITNERVARVGYNHFISNEGEWNNCFSKFSNRVLPPIFISTILQSVRRENLAHYFPYDVKFGLLADSRSFLANQKARNAIVGAENLLNNNYSMSLSWIWSDKITNERVARVGYNHFISNKGEWNNCFSKFSNRVLPPNFTSTILQSVRKENLAHCFPYDVKLGLLAHSRSFLANQKARNAIVGAENLLNKQ